MADGFHLANANEKLGKLPIWGWGLIIGGGIIGVYYLKKGNSTVPDASTTTADSSALTGTSGSPDLSGSTGTVAPVSPVAPVDTVVPEVPDVPDYGSNYGGGNNYGNQSSPTWTAGNGNSGSWLPTGTDTGQTTPTTSTGNAAATLDAWRAAAIAKANQNSTLSVTYSTKAIDAYLAGQPLTATQAAQVKKALGSLGTAPGTSLAVKVATATTAAATGAPTSSNPASVTPKATPVVAPTFPVGGNAPIGPYVSGFGVVGPVTVNQVKPGVPSTLKKAI
jgi:hypothetical protein